MTIARTSATLAPPLSRDAVIDLGQRLGDTPSRQSARLADWDRFEATPLPKLERTDLSQLSFERFTLAATANGDLPPDVRSAITGQDEAERAGLFVQSNGEVLHVSLDPALAKRGVIVASLAEAVQSHANLVERHLGRVLPAAEGKFLALNSALWTGGLFVYVPRNVVVEAPLQVVFHADADRGAVFPRMLVVTEESAAISILEEYTSPAGNQEILAVAVTEVVAAENAQVKFVHLQNWAENVVTFITQRAEATNNAVVNWTLGHLGARLMRSHTESKLVGEGANTQFLGVQFGNAHQHHDVYTLMNHIAPLTDGDLLFRGVLRDNARSVFEGLIKIHPLAQDTNSYLHHNTLILSDDARANSIPSLEIEANQVRASHGATVSQIDEDWIFYLQTRGLTRSEAIRAIVDGFFEPIMQRITLERVQARLRAAFDDKMGQHLV